MLVHGYPFCLRRSLPASRVFPLCLFLGVLFASPGVHGQTWKSLGPDGGDARALAADPGRPKVVYLGTTDGHIFGSEDAGRHWQLLGQAGASRKAVVTSILVDPRDPERLFASTWTLEKQGEGGGVYRSDDGGRSWHPSGLNGHAVRALAAAPSDPDTLVAGALDGVFRSRDSGKNWEMLTPANDPELRNFDSLAIDPSDPDTIYAGTFHLPWKTSDGGRDWVAIHDGMIDDSDVLSLAVNPSNREEVFASACSGIYRSGDAGAHWRRVQGIPESSRRTLVIRFDPGNLSTLFAGTTAGLWKSTDGGTRWRQISPGDWVVNALLVSPPSDEPGSAHLLLGTEQRGVVMGTGASGEFEAANEGFQHRRVVALTLDRGNPKRLGAVLANASEPVVQTNDGGETWSPLGLGSDSALVRKLFSMPDGWWAPVASGGLLRLDAKSDKWVREGVLLGRSAPGNDGATSTAYPARTKTAFRAVVNDLSFSDTDWFAATEEGLFRSSDAGKSWSPLWFSSLPLPVNSVRVSADGAKIRIVSSHGMVFSDDAGRSWKWHDLPLESYGPLRLEVADESTLLVTSLAGLYVSRDGGATWTKAEHGLPSSPVEDLLVRRDLWAVSIAQGGLYISRDRGANWNRIEGPVGSASADSFSVLESTSMAEAIYAGSANDGLYLLDLSHPSVLATRLDSGH